MAKDKDEQARQLAHDHYNVEPDITEIYRVMSNENNEQDSEEPIKLLEVNPQTVPTGVPMPIFFFPAPQRGIYYPSVVIEVTPEEFQLIKKNESVLPNGWTLGSPIEKPPT